MKKAKKSLLASALALVVCLAMLIGTTFAWFTDSVTNTGNHIQAGNLNVYCYWFKWDQQSNGGQGGFVQQNNPADQKMSASNWEPGQSNALMIRVDNQGLASKVQLSFDVTQEEKNLSDALWFHVEQWTGPYDWHQTTKPKHCGQPVYSSDTGVQSMSGIEDWQGEEMPLTQNASIGGGAQENLWHGWYLIEYGMYADAGNAYQGGSIDIDIHIDATQAPAEEDGFGSGDYDAGAAYPVSTADGLGSALENGGIISVANDMTLAEGVMLTGSADTVLDLDGKAVTLDQAGIIDLTNDAQITIQGNGTIDQEMTSDLGYLVRAAGNSKVIIKDGTFIGGLTCVQAGDNATVEIYGGHFEALVDWNGTYWLLNLIDNSNAQIIVYGGTFVNFDPSHSKTENPEANFVAEGYKVVSETQANGDIWYTVVPE